MKVHLLTQFFRLICVHALRKDRIPLAHTIHEHTFVLNSSTEPAFISGLLWAALYLQVIGAIKTRIKE